MRKTSLLSLLLYFLSVATLLNAASIQVVVTTDLWRSGSSGDFSVKFKRHDAGTWTKICDQTDLVSGNRLVTRDIIKLDIGHNYDFKIEPASGVSFDGNEDNMLRLSSLDSGFRIISKDEDTGNPAAIWEQSSWLMDGDMSNGGDWRVRLSPGAQSVSTPGSPLKRPSFSEVRSGYAGSMNGIGGLNFGDPEAGYYLEVSLGSQLAGQTAGSIIICDDNLDDIFDASKQKDVVVYAEPITRFANTISVQRGVNDELEEIETSSAKIYFQTLLNEDGVDSVNITVTEPQPNGAILRYWSIWRNSGTSGKIYIHYKEGAAPMEVTKITHSGNTWTYSTANDLYNEKIVKSTKPNDDKWLSRSIWEGTNVSDAVVIRKVFYNYSPWGWDVKSVTLDPGGLDMTTNYTYYEDANNENYRVGKLKTVINHDGSWKAFDYYSSNDYYGLLKYSMSPWKDSDLPSPLDFSTNSTSVVTETTWGKFSDRFLPDVVETKIEGKVTSKTDNDTIENTISVNGVNRQVLETTTKNYSASDSFLTSESTVFKDKGEGSLHLYGHAYKQVAPDKTQTSFNAFPCTISGDATNGYTASFTSGGEDTARYYVNGTSVDAGAVAFSSVNPWGGNVDMAGIYVIPGQSIAREIFVDEFGNTLRTATWVLSFNSNFTSYSWEVSELTNYYYNDLRQLYKITYSGGLEEEFFYDTRNRLIKHIDVDGTTIETEYDYLDRITKTTKKGVANTQYGAQADIVTNITYETVTGSSFGGKVTTTTSADGLSTQTIKETNIAGLIVKTTDALGIEIDYTYGVDYRQVTATYQDTKTEISLRYKNGMMKNLTGTRVVEQYYSYDIADDTTEGIPSPGYMKTTQYIGNASSERKVTTVTDWLGRVYSETVPAPNPHGGSATELTTSYEYNPQGQLAVVTPTGSNKVLYGYSAFGALESVSLDVDGNDQVDLSGSDRVSIYDQGYYKDSADTVWYFFNEQTCPESNDNRKVLYTNHQRIYPFTPTIHAQEVSYDINGNRIARTTQIDASEKLLTVTTDYPDATTNGEAFILNGRLVSEKTVDDHTYDYTYNSLGNLTAVSDPRVGDSVIRYFSNNIQVKEEENAAGDVVSYTYEPDTGRLATVTDPLGKTTRYDYNDYGQVTNMWGDNVHPVEYGYNEYGDMTKVITYKGDAGWTGASWPSSPGTGSKTEYTIDIPSGAVSAVKDPLGETVSTTYENGRIKTVTNARGQVITYNYDGATGDLTMIEYPGSMTNIEYSDYNRLGIPEKIKDASGYRIFQYNLSGDLSLKHERLPSTLGPQRYMNYQYDTSADTKGRYKGMSLYDQPNTLSNLYHRTEYGYAGATGRIEKIPGKVGNLTTEVNYTYRTDSPLLDNITYTDGSSTLQSQHFDYEPNRNLLTMVQFKNSTGGTVLSQFDYLYDDLGRRTNSYATGNHYNAYPEAGLMTHFQYNDRSELTSASQYFANNISDTSKAVRGRNWSFGYDSAGNRTSENGDSWTYGNLSNQLTERVVPGEVSASGFAVPGAYDVDRITVKASIGGYDNYVMVEEIQNQSTLYEPALRYGDYFMAEIEVDNGTNPVFASMAVFATDIDQNAVAADAPAGSQFVAKTPELYTYDEDGNLLTDGRWVYTFNAENQLTEMETRDVAYNQGVPRTKLTFAYDYQGRRFEKKVYTYSSGFVLDKHIRYVYDGWNLIAELDVLNSNAFIRRYFWGLDLSGTLGGAGGAGGLTAMVDSSTGSDVRYLPQYDGNGNLIGWTNSSNATEATFEYSPFGEMLAARYADAAAADVFGGSGFRHGTQYYDAETGLYYYGYRYYSPDLGRFINRDPIGFNGGYNLYGFVGNNPVNHTDYRGLAINITINGGKNGKNGVNSSKNNNNNDGTRHGAGGAGGSRGTKGGNTSNNPSNGSPTYQEQIILMGAALSAYKSEGDINSLKVLLTELNYTSGYRHYDFHVQLSEDFFNEVFPGLEIQPGSFLMGYTHIEPNVKDFYSFFYEGTYPNSTTTSSNTQVASLPNGGAWDKISSAPGRLLDKLSGAPAEAAKRLKSNLPNSRLLRGSSIGAFVEGGLEGGYAYVDGFNPFGSPLGNGGAYNMNDPLLQLSSNYGSLGFGAATVATGGALSQTAWAQRGFRFLQIRPGLNNWGGFQSVMRMSPSQASLYYQPYQQILQTGASGYLNTITFGTKAYVGGASGSFFLGVGAPEGFSEGVPLSPPFGGYFHAGASLREGYIRFTE